MRFPHKVRVPGSVGGSAECLALSHASPTLRGPVGLQKHGLLLGLPWHQIHMLTKPRDCFALGEALMYVTPKEQCL